MTSTVTMGLIGAGFAADLAARSLQGVYGTDVNVSAVCSRNRARANEFARTWHIPSVYTDPGQLMSDPLLDAVCICVPNWAHASLTIAALDAGKHVICEKPLTGAFGVAGAAGPERAAAERDRARASVDAIGDAVRRSGRMLMYAENWVYAPAVTKIVRLLRASNARVLDIRAEESHSGSHAPLSRRRETAGGGALMMLGSHPIGAALHLKRQEAAILGLTAPTVTTVTAEAARLDTSLADGRPSPWIVSDWDDVETWATALITFSDGTRATIAASFAMVGGVRNVLEAYTTTAAYRANLTPNDQLLAYTPDPEAFAGEYLHEKIETRTGWMSTSPDEDWTRGYPQEMQDFITCIATGHEPVSDLTLAAQVVDVIYAAYLSAEQGARVALSPTPQGQQKGIST